MTNKMKDLETALTAAGATVSPNRHGSDTVFANGYGIFCTVHGNIQARDVYDKDIRFGVGKFTDDAETLASNFMEGIKNPWA